MQIYPSALAMLPLPLWRCFTAFRRIPPARPAAILRAFLLEELSYPPVSDPLSSGLGLSAISFSSDVLSFRMVPPNHRNNPMNQVFFSEAGVALDASKRMNSPSSTYQEKNQEQILGLAPYPYDVDVLSFHNHVNHLPRERVPFFIEANPSA